MALSSAASAPSSPTAGSRHADPSLQAACAVLQLPTATPFPAGDAQPSDWVVLVPCGAVIDARGLEAGIRQLQAAPELAALVDLPVQEPVAGILLDLLLQPNEVRAVLCRREVLQACAPPLQLEGMLACARGALQIACGQEIARPPLSLTTAPAVRAGPHAGGSALDRELIRAFAIEDLYPVLREIQKDRPTYASILDASARLLRQGRRGVGFALGSWAEALVEQRDHGLGLLLDTAPVPTPVREDKSPLRTSVPDPLVTFVVPTRDRSELLARALTSVVAQTVQDLEVIVVDDGGPSPEPVLARFRHALGGGGRLTLVSHDRNRGLAAARNTGMRLARGRFVGFLDDDDRLLPNHLAALLPTLRRGARVVHGDVRSVIETPSSPLPTTESMVLHYQFDYETASYAVENYFPVHALLCERSLLLEAGPFDESLPVLEDWELWLRVFRISLPRHVRRVTAEVRQRSDGSNMTMERRGHWAEVSAQVYARTLDLEERDPQLRKRRVLYLQRLAERTGVALSSQVRAWMEGTA